MSVKAPKEPSHVETITNSDVALALTMTREAPGVQKLDVASSL